MNSLLVRADATKDIGIGHIMRCFALAQEWQEHGGKVVFLSHCTSDPLRLRVEKKGIHFIPLDYPHPDPADLQATLSLLNKIQAEWLVTDGYHFDRPYQQTVRKAGYRLLVIDDFAHLPEYDTDILLNQNINAEQLRYIQRPGTKLLLGTQYALLRPEFLTRRNRPSGISGQSRNVLVTMGGSDPANVTLKVIHALQQSDTQGLELRVIVGSANPHREILNRAIQYLPCNALLLIDVPDMPEQLAWADVAISAGGSTCWELAFMGVPAIILVLAENQIGGAEGLELAGTAINLGWFEHVSNGKISDTLISLLDDKEQRIRMSRSGRQLVDGNGANRIVRAILDHGNPISSGRLTIRPATMMDAVSLWQLANDPTTRMNAFNPEPIIFDRHVEWLKGKLASHDTRIWILELDGNFVAQVRYDRMDMDTAEIDFAVVPTFRGEGIGTKSLTLTCQAACTELRVKRLVGLAFDSNIPSKRTFANAGFRPIPKYEQRQGYVCSIFERSCEGV